MLDTGLLFHGYDKAARYESRASFIHTIYDTELLELFFQVTLTYFNSMETKEVLPKKLPKKLKDAIETAGPPSAAMKKAAG